MISYILRQLEKKFPYHYCIEEDYLRLVFLVSRNPSEMAMEALDFVEGLGFKFHGKKELGSDVASPGNWVNIEYRFRFNPETLPATEAAFLKSFKEMSFSERHRFINK